MNRTAGERAVFTADELAAWSRGAWRVRPAGPLFGVSIDTRSIEPGALYVALRGDRADGHAFVAQAFEKGAAAALVAAGQADALPRHLPLLVVPDTQRALVELAAGYRATWRIPVVAVTGSVGKTTVKEFCADVLGTRGVTARTLGNFNNILGVPLSILAAPRDAAFGVFEVGMNHPGELDPLCRLVRQDVGIVTAIGPVHIEHFPSVEAIAEEKATVFRTLRPDGVAIAPRDDAFFPLLAARAPCRVVTTSLRGGADYVAERAADGSGRFTVTETASRERHVFQSPLPGEYVVHNALLAIALGRLHGIGWDALAGAIAAYKPLHLRWEVEQRDGVEFIIDAYNANPVSMRAAARTLAEMPVRGGRWLVLGGMRELGAIEEAEHRSLGRDLSSGPWAGLLTVGPAGAWMADGARQAGLPADRVWSCETARDAARVLAERLHAGDVALLKASRGEKLEQVWQEWNRIVDEVGRG